MNLSEIVNQALEETKSLPKEQVMQVALLAKSRASEKRLQAGTMDFLGEDQEITPRQINRAKAYLFTNRIKEIAGCSECEENTPVCLDFHHEHSKKHHVSYLANSGRALEAIIPEILKCKIICSNCHRKHHHPQQKLGGVAF